MRAIVPFILLLTICVSQFCYSQDCERFLLMQEGRNYTSQCYDYESGSISSITYTTEKVTPTEHGYDALVSALISNQKNEQSFTVNYVMRCDGSNYYLDMSTYLSQLHGSGMDGMDVNISGDFLEMPGTLRVGDQLEGGKATLELSLDEIPTMSLSYTVMERQVLSIESVETAAGNVDCYKISYSFLSKMGVMNIRGKVIEWWSPEMVVVRSEHYDGAGKLTSATQIEDLK